MSGKIGLTDNAQALMMLLAFVLGPFSIWFGLGAPTDNIAVGLLASSLVGGVIAFIKEARGLNLGNNAQAYLMLVAFILGPFAAWFALGFPTDRLALGILTAALIGGVLAFIKEYFGVSPTPAPTEQRVR